MRTGTVHQFAWPATAFSSILGPESDTDRTHGVQAVDVRMA